MCNPLLRGWWYPSTVCALCRLLVRGLRTEGATVPAIAQILGVSDQRVSVLLKSRNGPVPPGE